MDCVIFVAASRRERREPEAALQRCAMKEPARGRHGEQRRHFPTAAGLAEDHHVARVAAEGFDVVVNPVERGDQVELTDVARVRVFRAAGEAGEIEIAEQIQPMIERDEHDVAFLREPHAVVYR